MDAVAFHSMFQNLHSFELSGSSRPEVFCKKIALKNFVNSQGNALCGSLFSRKVTGQLRIFRNFQGQSFSGHLRMNVNVLYFMISQKRKHFKSNNNCKSKGNMCTSLNWQLFYPQQRVVNFHFHNFPCRFFTLMKNRFHYAMVPCSRFIWITNSSDHRRV